MSADELGSLFTLLAPHLVAVALCAARLLPVSFLCPLLGGQSAPTTVRLALVLALGMSVHWGGGVNAPVEVHSPFQLAALVGKELVFGTVIGLVAALPFDAARMGGRFIDLFRGTSAEAALPLAGTRESATGDGLYQLLVALAVTGGAFPIVLGAIWKGFAVVKLGAFAPTGDLAVQVAALAGVAMATGLAVGAPIAGLGLAVDCLLGLVARAAPGMNLQETSAPLRIVGGGAVLWLAVGLLCERLLSLVTDAGRHLEAIFAGVAS
ncbi:MAG: flagellar biosynthetic protein FliR [Myxococcaceae bacterium]|nr:flagellar biosynthetic protein FliR [Myxococcaceae bacterium]